MYIVYSRGENKCILICHYFANQSCTFFLLLALCLLWVLNGLQCTTHPVCIGSSENALFLLILMLFPFYCRDYMNC